MPFTTDEVVGAIHRAGVKRFTARKLERWANLGVLPHAKRKGLGRGKGFVYLWSGEALWGALFIADAFTWRRGRRFEDAVLWAWLRGAPIPLAVVRRYLLGGIQRQRGWLDRHLKRQRRQVEDEALDLVDRVAQALALKHGTLRKLRVPVDDRIRIMQETIAHLKGEQWSVDRSETIEVYKRADEAILAPLIGIPWKRLQPRFTSASEVLSEQRFYSYPQLERLVHTAPDDEFLAARNGFAAPLYETSALMDRLQAGHRVSSAEKVKAEDTYRIYSILFQMDPSWVIALFLKAVIRSRKVQAR